METYNILTVPSTPERMAYMYKHLQDKEIRIYKVYEGEETEKRYDGLFKNIQRIVKDNYDKDYVIILEDDVAFTKEFDLKTFEERMLPAADQYGADVLLGGIKEEVFAKPIPSGRWFMGYFHEVKNYRGSQLMVIFKKYYDKILAANPHNYEFEVWTSYQRDVVKLVTVPFIAYQADFQSRFLAKDKHMQDYIDCETRIFNKQLKQVV